MTQSGEELTLKGESGYRHDTVFSFHKAMAVSYAVDMDSPGRIEIRMSYPDHRQSETLRMIFVLRGEISFMGQLEFAAVKIGTQQHNLCRISSAAMRMIMSDPADEVICINLSEDFVGRYLPQDHPAQQRLTSRTGSQHPVMLSPFNMSISPEISGILQRLSHTAKSEFCDQLLLESKVIELLALQLSQFEQIQDHGLSAQLKQGEQERMQEVREIVINNTGEQLSLRSLAHLVGTNEFNLKRDFKAAFGTTVYRYLNQYKMEQAKTLLIEKDMTIAEIALKIGYKHATHFTTAFKKYFGYLPNRIRSGKLALLFFVEDFTVLFEQLEFLFVKI